jgi:hypothetical protein
MQLSKLLSFVWVVLLVSCGKPTPHTLYLHLNSNQPSTLAGSVSIDGKTQSVLYQAPTNLSLTGSKIQIHIALQDATQACDVHFYTDELLKLPPLARQSATNSVARLKVGMRHFHFRSSGGARFRSLANDSPEMTEQEFKP